MFAKVEERIGAIPSGSTTDAELTERFLFVSHFLYETEKYPRVVPR